MNPRRITIGVAAGLLSSTLFAQAGQPVESPLDELLKTPISTAAKYDQPMSDVAAAVTVITAEEIARNGWHTLAEALSAVRGVYTTYDRAYTYLGVRGFGMPTDYNDRFLLLLDGHPLLDNISGSVGIDTTLAIDLSHFARIELIRGPGSVLYGTGAMFGVINLITKDEGESSSAMAGAGSNGLATGSARGSIRRGAFKASVAASWQESAGADLYIPEYDHPDTNHGVVNGRDSNNYRSLMATVGWKNLRVLLLHSTRTKGVPTGSWGTTFGSDQTVTDGRALLAADFEQRLGTGKTLFLRAFHDRFAYDGKYPASYDYRDYVHSVREGAEARLVWDVRPGNRLTVGGEYVDNRAADYRWDSGPYGKYQIGGPFHGTSFYFQDDAHINSRLTLTAGARFDRYSNSGSRITPRGAAIFQIAEGSVLKALYGAAFRAPNVYELHYGDEPTTGFLPAVNLQAEDIRTTELVWEQRLGEDLLFTTSLFDTKVRHLIELDLEPGGEFAFKNMSNARSRGGELQLDYRRNDGIWSYLSYSRQRTVEQDEPIINSPVNLLKAGLSSSTARRAFGAVEMQYESGRITGQRHTTGGVLLTNVNLGAKLTHRLSLSLTVRNAFDVAYATPGGAEHIQDTIAQDGRSFLLRLRVTGR
jgi:outer membrane receptor protein involved in Fe transport